jgi:hypothetical protein
MTKKKKATRPQGLASIVPTDNYEAQVSAGLRKEERDNLEAFLAATPESVPIAQGLGGARKLRWALSDVKRGKGETQAKGKRGGARIIYFYRRENHAVYMLDAYLKGDKEGLSADDKRAIAKAIQVIQAKAPKAEAAKAEAAAAEQKTGSAETASPEAGEKGPPPPDADDPVVDEDEEPSEESP